MLRHLLLSLSVLLFVPTCSAQGSGPAKPIHVSLVQLLATPEKFDGKLVSVIGFLRLEHEAYLLYLHKEDYDNVILANALWVDATEEMGRDRESLGLKYVMVVGTFRTGHEKRNLFSVGGLTDIQSCQFWSDPADPLENKIKNMHK